MSHYGAEEWADFARGLVETKKRRSMSDHLARCGECADWAGWLEVVTLAARNERQIEPLAGAVRSVKAYFTVRQPLPRRRFTPLALEVVFDSLLLPRPSGARGSAATTRQLVCYASDYALTLRLDQEAADLRLDGEILSRQTGPLPDARAFLLSKDEVLSQAVSGRLGEFDLHTDRREALRLSVVIEDDRCLEVDLDPPAPQSLRKAENVIQISSRDAPGWGSCWPPSAPPPRSGS